nr:immunoglobulin light chain junction region [Macaca mulatta]
CLQYNVNPWTF